MAFINSQDDATQSRQTSALAFALPLSISSPPSTNESPLLVPQVRIDHGANSTRDLVSYVANFLSPARSTIAGALRLPPLPPFSACWRSVMAASEQYQVPSTPRVISPSPTPSEMSASDAYFGPMTRSKTRTSTMTSPPPLVEEDSSGSDPEKRARARSRSSLFEGRRRRMSGLTLANGSKSGLQASSRWKGEDIKTNGTVNGHLSPESAAKSYWRAISRSPSPLGLIPIHQKWRVFVSRPG